MQYCPPHNFNKVAFTTKNAPQTRGAFLFMYKNLDKIQMYVVSLSIYTTYSIKEVYL